jgi:hypothetical protein
MDGGIMISYKVLCEGDLNNSIALDELLKNEKVLKVIKSEFAKGYRNVDIRTKHDDVKVEIVTSKKIHTLEVTKDDYADILALAEDDATSKKLFKKGCSRIELVDIETI